jgi:hypothetical protein
MALSDMYELVVVRDRGSKLAGLAAFYTSSDGELAVDYLVGIQAGGGVRALREVGLQVMRRRAKGIGLTATVGSRRYYKKLGMTESGFNRFSMDREQIRRRWGNG